MDRNFGVNTKIFFLLFVPAWTIGLTYIPSTGYGFSLAWEKPNVKAAASGVREGFYFTLKRIQPPPKNDKDLLQYKTSYTGGRSVGVGIKGLTNQVSENHPSSHPSSVLPFTHPCLPLFD